MSQLVANDQGVITGRFTIPPHIPAGAKTVAFEGAENVGTRGSAVFVGQGNLTVQTLQQVNTVTTYWVDPLAQTFVLDGDTQICGADLWFTASGGDARIQLREVSNGVPTRVVLAEVHVPASSMVISGGGHTRILFPAPVALSGNEEYALVVLCDDATTAVAIAEMGKFDAMAQTWVVSQPYTIGVLLSSSNASAWTAHQVRVLAFRLLRPVYTAAPQVVDLGGADTDEVTDMVLLSLAETPSARTSLAYGLTLPDGAEMTVADGQVIRLDRAVAGAVRVRATLAGDTAASPVLWPGSQLIGGKVQQTADYYTRSIPARNATRAILIYDAIVPSGAGVMPEIRVNDGAWQALTPDGTTQQGDGLVEFRYVLSLADMAAEEIKGRITLTGTNQARPRVRNIRMMAVA